MAQLKDATVEMFEEIYSTLLRRHDPTIPRERWRNIFIPAWGRPPDDKVGYVLEEGGRLVGFLGLIVTERIIAGSLESFANVTSWVAPSGSGQGALLVFPLRDVRSFTITNLTSTPIAYRVFKRLGFRELETHYRIIPTLQRRRGSRWEVTENDQEVLGALTESDRIIYRDHAPYVRQLVARLHSTYCYMVFSTVKRRRVRVAKVHHFGGQAAPAAVIPDIGRYLLRERILALDCDERLIGPLRNVWNIRRKLEVPRLYRSNTLGPEQVSELYSELVLLGKA